MNRRSFRLTGMGSYTAHSRHPFNARFFEELDARLSREPQRPIAPLPSVSPRSASFPPARRA